MEAFQGRIAAFERYDAQVLGVSPDDMDSHNRFAAKLGLTFPLVSDPGNKIAEKYAGFGRFTFVIDKTGTIRYFQKGMPDNDKILEVLAGL